MGYGIKYTEEMKQFIFANYKGVSNQELTDKVNAEFGTKITLNQIKAFKTNHKLNSGLTGQFVKGQIAHNKGQKMSPEVYEKVKHTMFKKGNVPHCYKPVGSERINVDGYVEVKVEDPATWKLKQRLVYETHYGPIPPKSVVIFLDGNKLNFDINNLKCISWAENAFLTQNKLHGKSELTETGVIMAKLKEAVKDKEKMLTNVKE